MPVYQAGGAGPQEIDASRPPSAGGAGAAGAGGTGEDTANIGGAADLLSLLGILAIGALLGFSQLGARSFSAPEIDQVLLSRAPIAAWLAAEEVLIGPLYPILLRLWALFAPIGPGEAYHRMLGVALGLATATVLYFLGRRLCDRKIGLAAAFLYVLAPLRVLADRTLGPGPALALATVAGTLFLARTLAGAGAASLTGYGICAVAGCFVHPSFAAVLFAHALWILLRWSEHRSRAPGALAATALGLAGLLAPLLWCPQALAARFRPVLLTSDGNLPIEALSRILYSLHALAVGETVPLAEAWVLVPALAAAAAALALGVAGLTGPAARLRPLLVPGLALPLLLIALNPAAYPAAACAALPFAALLFARGALGARPAWLRFALLLLLTLASVKAIANDFGGRPESFDDLSRIEDFRNQASMLRDVRRPSDEIWVLDSHPGFFFYEIERTPICRMALNATGALTVEAEGRPIDLPERLERLHYNYLGVWLLVRVETGRVPLGTAEVRKQWLETAVLVQFAVTDHLRNFAFGDQKETAARSYLRFMGFAQPTTILMRRQRHRD